MKTRLIVFGFCRNCEKLLLPSNANNAYYRIPPLICHICIWYYYQKKPVNPEDVFDIIQPLGEASYRMVYKALDKRDGELVALKIMPFEENEINIQEQLLIKSLKSPYIINIKEHYIHEDNIWFVMDYCSGGDVHDLMQVTGHNLDEQKIQIIMRESLKGLKNLHNKHILHRNIKARNILIDHRGGCKLSDTLHYNDYAPGTSHVIPTPYWLAPEMLRTGTFDAKTDIWSLGITAIEMATGNPPYYNQPPLKVLLMIPKCDPPNLPLNEEWSDDFREFVTLCTMKDPNERPSAEQLLDHIWIRNGGLISIIQQWVITSMPLLEKQREQYKEEEEEEECVWPVDDEYIYGTMIMTGDNYNDNDNDNDMYGTMIMAADDQIGLTVGGAKDVNNFRKCIEQNIMPSLDSITYNGLLYEYYFDTKTRQSMMCKDVNEEMLFYPSYCYAMVNKLEFNITDHDTEYKCDGNKIKYEYYMSVGLNSNIKQSDFKRKQLNLVVVLDRSGSMNDCFDAEREAYYAQFSDNNNNNNTVKTKMDIANECVVGLLKHLTPNDRFGLVIFDHESQIKQNIDFIENINMNKLKHEILNIKAAGGTDFECGYNDAIDLYLKNNIKTNEEYDNRLILLTDAQPNHGMTDPNNLLSLVSKYSENKENYIYTTFIGVGLDFNSNLIQTISETRGSNYYSVKSTHDFIKTMDEEFEFMVTPLVFNVCLKLKCEGNSCEIEKVYGSSAKNEQDIVKNGEITKINTLFPSKKSKEKRGTKGGIKVIQLKKAKDNNNDNINVQLEVTFEDRNGKIYVNEQNVIFKSQIINNKENDMIEYDEKEKEEEKYSNNFYDNIGIRKGILLCKYVELIREWIQKYDNGYYRAKLKINDDDKNVFVKFMEHFKKEMLECKDDTLQKEVDILNKMVQISSCNGDQSDDKVYIWDDGYGTMIMPNASDQNNVDDDDEYYDDNYGTIIMSNWESNNVDEDDDDQYGTMLIDD